MSEPTDAELTELQRRVRRQLPESTDLPDQGEDHGWSPEVVESLRTLDHAVSEELRARKEPSL